MARKVDITSLADIESKFSKLDKETASKIDNGGTRPIRKRSTKRTTTRKKKK